MSDDSDDGNWKGESQFIKGGYRNDDNYEDDKDDGDYYNEYNENYNQNYNKEMDYGNEDKNYEDNNDNEDYNNNDYYYDEDYYCDEDYDYDYDENNNDDYNLKYNYNNNGNYKNNYNRNGYHNYNHYNNNNINNKQFRNNNRGHRKFRFQPTRGGTVKSIKSKEYYFSEFRINFKLWLMIVLKLIERSNKKIEEKEKEEDPKKEEKQKKEESQKKKEEQIITINFDEDKKINEEICESFKNLYNYKKDKNENKNNLNIEIENIEIKKIIRNNYDIEFNIIITEELKVYFIKKYINIKVIGEVDNSKYPKFYFQLEEYKLELYYNNEKKDNKENKQNKDNKENGDSSIIIDIKGKKEKKREELFKIEMKPDYSINNKKFKKYFKKLHNNDDNDDKDNKGPQEEIRDIFSELNEILNKEKKV